uniref:Immunoglobulin domain-containing protein n=1 Tax=Mastacembelus armatus TaxID=205130 RepID=A0A3Q3RQQ4_9TELE
MRSFTLVTILFLCSLGWVSVSGSESEHVQVQPGEEVTPLCPNISTTPTQTDWFRLVKRTKPCCVSSMFDSNVSTVFLKVKHVDLSDSGLYFCGFYINKHTVIASAVELSVQGETIKMDCKAIISILDECDGRINLITVILGCLTVLLTIVIIGLAVKIRRLQTAMHEEKMPEINKNRSSDDLNYAPLNFRAKPKRNRRPASERQLEPNVVYAATR